MYTNNPVFRTITIALFTAISLLGFTIDSYAEAKTTIILIDAQPVLVQLGPKGEIYERYIKVPEYFRTRRSHERLVGRYKRKVGILSKAHKTLDKNHFLAVTLEKKQEKADRSITLSNGECESKYAYKKSGTTRFVMINPKRRTITESIPKSNLVCTDLKELSVLVESTLYPTSSV